MHVKLGFFENWHDMVNSWDGGRVMKKLSQAEKEKLKHQIELHRKDMHDKLIQSIEVREYELFPLTRERLRSGICYFLIFVGVFWIVSAIAMFVFAISKFSILPGLVIGGVTVLMLGGGVKLRKKRQKPSVPSGGDR